MALQQALAIEEWPEDLTLPTRVALHSGEAELRDGDYYGQTLNRAARLRALAQGGHVLLSQGTAELVAHQLPSGTSLADVGEHYLKGCLDLSTSLCWCIPTSVHRHSFAP